MPIEVYRDDRSRPWGDFPLHILGIDSEIIQAYIRENGNSIDIGDGDRRSTVSVRWQYHLISW